MHDEKREKRNTLLAIWLIGVLMLGMMPMVFPNVSAAETDVTCYDAQSPNSSYCWVYWDINDRQVYLKWNLAGTLGTGIDFTSLTLQLRIGNAYSPTGTIEILGTSSWSTWALTSHPSETTSVLQSFSQTLVGWQNITLNAAVISEIQTQYDATGWAYIKFGNDGHLPHGSDTWTCYPRPYSSGTNNSYPILHVGYTAGPAWVPTITSSSSGHTTAYIGNAYSYHLTANESVTWGKTITTPFYYKAYPYADSYNDQGNPASNFGSASTLISKGGSADQIVMRWDGLNIPGTPTNWYLNMFKAYESMPVAEPPTHGTSNWGTVTDHTWSESTVTWNTGPNGFDNYVLVVETGTGWKNYTDSSMNGYLNGQLSSWGDEVSILYTTVGESGGYYNQKHFYSKDESGTTYDPYMVVKYTPTWLTIDSNGYLNGTPTVTGTYHVNVSAMNSQSGYAYQEFDIVVTTAPAISSTPITSVMMTHAYSYVVTTEAGTISLDGTNASWLTFSSGNNTLWGRAPYGKHSYYVHLKNSYNSYQNFTLTVTGWKPTVTATYGYDEYNGYPAPSHAINYGYSTYWYWGLVNYNETIDAATSGVSSNVSSFWVAKGSGYLQMVINHGDTIKGSYWVSFYANSTNGHMIVYYNYTLTIGDVPPTVTMGTIYPTGGYIVNTQTFASINWTGTAGSYAIDHYHVAVYNGGFLQWNISVGLSTSYSFNNMTGYLLWTAIVWADDGHGNLDGTVWTDAWWQRTQVITTITNPTVGSTKYAQPITATWDHTGSTVAMSQIRVKLYHGTWGSWSVFGAVTSADLSVVNGGDLADGAWVMAVEATDIVGSVINSSVSFNVATASIVLVISNPTAGQIFPPGAGDLSVTYWWNATFNGCTPTGTYDIYYGVGALTHTTSGVTHWTHSFARGYTYTVRVEAHATSPTVDVVAYANITIYGTFLFTSTPTTTVVNGTYWSYTFATNVSGASYSIINAPSWVTISGTSIHGKAPQEGAFLVWIQASNSGQTCNQSFDLIVTEQTGYGQDTSDMWLFAFPFVVLMVIAILASISREGISGTCFLGSITVGIFTLFWAGAMPLYGLVFGILLLVIMVWRAWRVM